MMTVHSEALTADFWAVHQAQPQFAALNSEDSLDSSVWQLLLGSDWDILLLPALHLCKQLLTFPFLWERPRKLELFSLERRRFWSHLIVAFQCLKVLQEKWERLFTRD